LTSAGARRAIGAKAVSADFARVNVETAELTEEYRYKQELSRNRWTAAAGEPVGRIRVVVPYDGGGHFTREAIADLGVEGISGEALIGHLVLSGYGHTDLGLDAGLDETAGAIPLQVPVGGELSAEDLAADRQAFVLAHEYRADLGHLPAVPIAVQAFLLDPDGVDLARYRTAVDDIKRLIKSLPGIDAVSAEGRRRFEQQAAQTPVPGSQYSLKELISDLATQIQQQVSFRSSLQLRLVVLLFLPSDGPPADSVRKRGAEQIAGKAGDSSEPRLERVAIEWPTITSLRAVHLEIPGSKTQPRIVYNPNTRCVEWFEVPMTLLDGDSHGGLRTYSSPPMILNIEQPGELYERPSLRGTVSARVDGTLLSGTQARLFDATGRPVRAPATSLRSVVEAEFELILGDAFTGRILSPFQHLVFDQVIPDPARIADVETALESRGFDVVKLSLEGESAPAGGTGLKHFLFADRAEGPDTMQLWIYIEGRNYTTERESQRAGGTKYTTKLDSGELKIYVRGSLPGDSRELVLEMNTLQKVLREQFARIRQIA